jgi:hypothetical protein
MWFYLAFGTCYCYCIGGKLGSLLYDGYSPGHTEDDRLVEMEICTPLVVHAFDEERMATMCIS